jgi:hypothetical protein
LAAGEFGVQRAGDGRDGGCSAGQGGVELEEVVAGGDELPFGAAGGQSAALEPRDAAQELGAGEHGLDDVLAFGPVWGVEDRVDALSFRALAS